MSAREPMLLLPTSCCAPSDSMSSKLERTGEEDEDMISFSSSSSSALLRGGGEDEDTTNVRQQIAVVEEQALLQAYCQKIVEILSEAHGGHSAKALEHSLRRSRRQHANCGAPYAARHARSKEEVAAGEAAAEEETGSGKVLLSPDDAIIELNVGGEHFTTFKSTLCSGAAQGSMLEAMFSGRHHLTTDKEGRVFIDRPPQLFSILLDYLRTGIMPSSITDDMRADVMAELDYFGVDYTEKKELSWEIERWSRQPHKIRSREFSIGGNLWTLHLMKHKDDDAVGLYLECMQCNNTVEVEFTLAISYLKDSKKRTKCKFREKGQDWGFYNFSNQDRLKRIASQRSDTLIIQSVIQTVHKASLEENI